MSTRIGNIVGEARSVSEDLTRDGKGWILAAVASGWFLSIGVRYVYPSLVPFFRETFDMNLTVAGSVMTAVWGAYALGQFPGGIIGDRIGEGNVLVVSSAAAMVAVALEFASVNLLMLFVGAMAYGASSALYATTRFTIFTDIYTERAGTAVGLTMAVGSVGNTVLPPLAAAVASYATWRLGFGVLAPLFAVTGVALWLVVPGRTSTAESPDELSAEMVRRLLAAVVRDRIPIVAGAHLLLGFASLGFLGFYPTYLIEIKGFSPSLAATLYGLYFAVGTILQPVAGVVNDRFGPRVTLTAVAGLFTVGLFAIRFVAGLAAIALVTLLISNRNAVGVVTNTHIADALPDDIKGAGLGLLRSSWLLVAATGPTFVGYLADLGRFEDAFLVLAVAASVATGLALFVPTE